MTALLWWLALFGVWPFADSGHDMHGSFLSRLDLALHFAAAMALLSRVDW